jgi:hypothetical protein
MNAYEQVGEYYNRQVGSCSQRTRDLLLISGVGCYSFDAISYVDAGA